MAITSQQEAELRITEFVNIYGNGKEGLTLEHKKARMKKVLGQECEKVKGFGIDINIGIEFKRHSNTIPAEGEMQDGIPKEVLDNLKNYPRENDESHRILFMEVEDNGGLNYEGIILNGNEKDPKTRSTFAVYYFDDEISTLNEYKQYQQGKLKEVSDRTMAIHKELNQLNELLTDEQIDTSADKYKQY